VAQTNEGSFMISILIPTLNRPEFLYRALKYYKTAGFDGVISIGDSSNPENAAQNLLYIDHVSDVLDIDYKYYEKDEYDIGSVVKDQIDRARTPYVAICCDDDFLNVQGVKKCASFLDDKPDYASARGIRINFMLSDIDNVYGDIDKLQYVPSLDLDDDRPSVRWAAYMNCNTATAYNVHRKETFLKMWHNIDHYSTYDLRYELVPCSVTCITGKTKNLDVLYNVVQQHHGSVSYSGKITIYNAIIGEGWSSDVKNFSDYICEELKTREKMSEEEARTLFYKEFEKYLLSHFLYQSGADSNNVNIDRITNLAIKVRTFIRNSPRLSALLRTFLYRKLDASRLYNHPTVRSVSLSSMLDKSSPYREDFSLIADILSTHGKT
jgi:glycosyltransferase domain-containing protein